MLAVISIITAMITPAQATCYLHNLGQVLLSLEALVSSFLKVGELYLMASSISPSLLAYSYNPSIFPRVNGTQPVLALSPSIHGQLVFQGTKPNQASNSFFCSLTLPSIQ